MCYELKRLNNEDIDRTKCETIIEHVPKLREKPNSSIEWWDWWIEERLCIYDGRYIYFKKKEENNTSYFHERPLEPFEVSEDFFLALKEEWKKKGCGYYVIL